MRAQSLQSPNHWSTREFPEKTCFKARREVPSFVQTGASSLECPPCLVSHLCLHTPLSPTQAAFPSYMSRWLLAPSWGLSSWHPVWQLFHLLISTLNSKRSPVPVVFPKIPLNCHIGWHREVVTKWLRTQLFSKSWIKILALLFLLDKPLHLSVTQFLHLHNGENNSMCSPRKIARRTAYDDVHKSI